jgi:hypothetical protein
LLDPDADSGEQKLPTKIEKVKNFNVLKCWMFSFEGGLGISKLQFLIKKNILKKFSAVNFFNFWSSKPWTWNWTGFGSALGSGSVSGSALNQSGSTILLRSYWCNLYYIQQCFFCLPSDSTV